MTKQDEEHLRHFERKMLRKIFGPKCKGGDWFRRTNMELCELLHL